MAGDRLELPNGIPSHDTFRWVFLLIDPDAFEACFTMITRRSPKSTA